MRRRLRSGELHSRPALATKVCENPISMEKSWAWWYVPVIPATAGGIKYKDHGPGHSGKKRDPISKIIKATRAGGVAQEDSACLASRKP
jgi:hypothetical protein